MSQLKIVHISTSVNGGAGIAAYRIHEALLGRNVNSFFLSLDAPLGNGFKSCTKVVKPHLNLFERGIRKLIRITDRYYSLGKLLPRKYYTAQLAKLLPMFNCEVASLPYSVYNILNHPLVINADIIHLHWVAGILDYPSFFLKNKKPVAWTLHDMNPALGLFHYKNDVIRNDSISSGLDDVVKTVKTKAIKNRKSKLTFICPSKWLLKAVEESKVLAGLNGCNIYYPLDTDIFCPKENTVLRQQLGIPETNTILLFVSQTVENYRKGFDLLTSALNKIENAKITLLIIGYTNNKKISGTNVIYLESIVNNEILSNYYSLAEAFILPSREDNLPNVMLEAIACGTPVLSFNVGGMGDVIEDNFNGIKAKEISAHSLKEVIQQFVKQKKQFNKEKIREFALNNFSNNVIADKYLAVYKDLLSTNEFS